MSKHVPAPDPDPTAQAAAQPDQSPGGLSGGSFRLDAMSPGSDGAVPDIGTPAKPWRSRQGIALTLLLIGAACVVYGMRRMGIGPMASLAQVKVPDYDVTRGAAVRGGDHQRLITELAASHVEAQVPADQVQKNPFRLADALRNTPDEPADTSSIAAQDRARREAEARRLQIDKALASLSIHGILGGSTPVARIGAQTVRVGDTVADIFTVTAIHGRAVELEVDGQTHTLSIDDAAAGPARKR